MQFPFRDERHLVATDGHRLHYCEQAEKVAPHSLGGEGADYPQWQHVIPQGSPAASCLIRVTREALKRLDALAKLRSVDERQCGFLFVRNGEGNQIELSFEDLLAMVKAKATLDISESSGVQFSFCLNLRYLLDVLKAASATRPDRAAVVRMDFWEATIPIKFTVDKLGEALISPMRVD